MNIYQSRIADKLTDPLFFTPAIDAYLQEEASLLQQMLGPFDTVIEAGCTTGRHAKIVTGQGRLYVGIDIAPHQIEQAQAMLLKNGLARFVCGDIGNLEEIVARERLALDAALLVFPFNVLGNLPDPAKLLEWSCRQGLRLVIFTYAAGGQATTARAKYYRKCGFENVSVSHEPDGTRFTSEDGLNSMAYTEQWFQDRLSGFDATCTSAAFGGIGRMIRNF